MGELTIRRNRTFEAPRYQGTGKVGKQAGSSQARQASGTTGINVSDTLRQLMSRVNQAESRLRESRRTLQKGEVVLDEVQESLGRMAELAKKAAEGGEQDRAALQEEFERLAGNLDRMIGSASVGGVQLFLDEEIGSAEEIEALLYSVMDGASDGEEAALPDWLVRGIAQSAGGPEKILNALGLDQTAGGAEILSALAGRSPESDSAAGYLATLYLGAVIAGGSAGTADPERALDGLRQLLELVSDGVSPDEALAQLTNGEFTSFAEFQEQFAAGTAPGLEEFLTNLLLSDGGAVYLDASATLMDLLAGMEGMNLASLMDLLGKTTTVEAGPGPDAAQAPVQEQAAETAEAAGTASAADASPRSVVTEQVGDFQVTGRDLSAVSVDEATGTLTVGGTADVAIQGGGGKAIVVNSSAVVTLQNVSGSTLTAAASETHISLSGENALVTMQVREGITMIIDGPGALHLKSLQGSELSVLHLAGGRVTVEKDGELAPLTIPVILEGPVSLAAQAASVRNPEGKSLEPFDIIWKALLPGFSEVASMALDGKQAKMAMLGGNVPALARLWMEKGDPSHGYPHMLVARGRDATGHPKTRYAYLVWSQQDGTFQEISMYPNPFTITGGEESRDWVYEEESHTLRILSNQVTAIAGGEGTDAARKPFSGRIALADGIGEMELTLGGVVCRVSSGRAFHLGRENVVTLLLQSGTKNLFESGAGFAGISLGDGTSLHIDSPGAHGQEPAGTLTATGGSGGAGIGKDSYGGKDRTSHIMIHGGVITAVGTGGGAGIGAGKRGFMGPVTIVGGVITSTGGKGGGAGIGGALGAPVGDISIRGGTVTASAVYHAAAIGAGVQGASGDISISGTARIEKAVGGDPGADIGACLFGGCGKVLISGGADIGSARLWTKPGVSLQVGEDIVMLPQFRLSARALQVRKMSLATREEARAAGITIEADRRWVSQIQSAYGAMYERLEESSSLSGARQYIDQGLVRDTDTASTLLLNIRQSIPLPSSRAMYTLGKRKIEAVEQLLR